MQSREVYLARFHQYLDRNQMQKNPHQEEGIWWCVQREMESESLTVGEDDTCVVNTRRGGIVADEMGLGKTILMLGLFASNFVRNTLIVVPLPLLNQWKKEIKRTLGHDVLVYHGSTKNTITKEMLQESAIVLTTYGALRPSSTDSLYSVKWNRVIYDEAHHMRNSSSKKYFYGKFLHSDSRWLLSGTPVQNRIGDLYSLFHILGYKYKEVFEYETFRHLRNHHILRRTKSSVGIDLPKIHYKNVEVNWKNDLEKNISEKIHNLVENKLDPKDIHWMDSIGDRKLIQMIRARQMCVCPRLIAHKIMPMIKHGILSKEYTSIATSTSKLDSVVDLVKNRSENGNKKIIFCTFHAEIKLIEEKLKEKNIENIGIYTGKLNLKMRQEIIDNEPDILIMQIQAGCEGLNLQTYNEVYIVSPHWNPCVEDQAIGRCYRMGQKKETYVYMFNMKSIDEKVNSMDNYIQDVQKNKRMLQDELLI